MNNEQLYSLLEKYWSCETSLREEEELKKFFSEGNVPDDLCQFTPLFSYFKDEQQISLSDDFNKRLNEIPQEREGTKYITIRVFRPLLHVAVSILLIIGVGVSFYFISKQDNRPQFVETFEDPNAAMQQAAFALEKLSSALQKSETASAETIRFIDELDIDWDAIDSLHREALLESDKQETDSIY